MPKNQRHRIGHKSKSFPEDIMKEVGQMQDLKVRIHKMAEFFGECPEFIKDEDETEFQSMNEYFNFIFVRFFDDIEQHFFVSSQKIQTEELLEELNVIEQELNFVEEYVDLQDDGFFRDHEDYSKDDLF